ncbi:nicotinate-nucleotide adenylyltransferase [Pontiella agarivorans]|uniref:Probable nicotinate-nucleotide adenylyltransferase n=1 Tax=Pontiella agarivorans TaxID=3038953 RepID=A0ABU5N000_9BACT|nr:nicotinate-nucleotide adenylyltransferase [Pontiella agarivorans]MDZ8119775.1 nicotinate-nucleotide adenylyltransferase [Pontiella agarivorans]
MNEPAPVRRFGLFGGSFDPVHSGHLIIAQDAAEKLELDQVVFIPAAIPPHKQHLQQASAEHRLNMLKLALKSDRRFFVSDVEISRGGVSYFVDTVSSMKRDMPAAELFLIVGSDTLVDLHNWYRIDEIMKYCEITSFLRPGEDDIKSIKQKVALTDPLRQRVLANTFESHMVGISSSEIRMRIAEGLGIRYLVSAEVEQYIFEHGLYQG